MNRWRNATAAFALLLCVSTPSVAQRFRVVVGVAGTSKLSVVEFRPCVPAETSDCGVWLDRVVDAATDSSFGHGPLDVRRSLMVGRTRVSIVDRSITVTPPGQSRAIAVKGIHGIPKALADGGDGASVFAVSEPLSAEGTPEVCLIDLRFNEVVARLKLDASAAGIEMARR